MQRETTVRARVLGLATAAAAIVALPAALPAQSAAPANAKGQPSPAPLAEAPAIPRNIDLNAATEYGYAFFQQKCLTCHGNPQFEKAPPPEALYQYTPERIYESLTTGVMASVIGNQLTDAEKRAVSETITGQRIGAAGSGDADKMPNRCKTNPPLEQAAQRPAWNGWGADVQNTRFQSAAAAGLTAADVPKLKLRWAFGLPNSTSAYAQPAMVFGRVFIGADTGYVYSLDADTGCVHWSYHAQHSVRTAMTLGRVKSRGAHRYAVFFGDRHANVYAVDAHTGKQLWIAHPESNFTARITAAPTYYEGGLYVPLSSFEEFSAAAVTYECCKSLGGVAALDANTGKLLWKRYVVPELPKPTYKNSHGVQQWGPAGGSVWNSPTVDPVRRAVYFGTGDATTYPAISTSDAVMAVDMDSGRVLWSYQVHKNDSFLVGCGETPTENCPKVVGPDWDIPASPVLRTLPDGTRRIIVVTKPGDILALDPDKSGHLVYRVNVFGTVAGDGEPLRPNAPTPPGIFWGAAINQETAYFGLTRGGVGALDIATGKRLWLNPLDTERNVSYGSATTAFPGVVLQGASNGTLHAVSTEDGRSLWSFDTRREFETVNGVKARGGSISAPGPIVADGIVLVGSGYAILGGTPGNVLLAFSAK
ncbi:MAG TPA: PQQ-binding-like beta-propeller repeat protein [Steroidobacteraceae bacterium]|jgi:polyvinyl alcohol dehydrogenase (cytochrome)|nr:PQQ-binding-like beta-propeller repeat protein [Steroidobacteraceae bacterium]